MKTNQEMAFEVIAGKWGVGQERRRLLESAGYNYDAVQSIVNAIMSGREVTPEPAENTGLLKVELDMKKFKGLEVIISL